MAADDKKNMTCNCGGGRMGGHWTFFLLRTLLTILILMIIFWFGVQVGRMTGYAGREDFMMRSGYGRAMPMMQVGGAGGTTSTSAADASGNY